MFHEPLLPLNLITSMEYISMLCYDLHISREIESRTGTRVKFKIIVPKRSAGQKPLPSGVQLQFPIIVRST
jgi:hypothetical protein